MKNKWWLVPTKGIKPRFTKGNWERMPGTSQPRIAVEGEKEWPIVMVSAGPTLAETKANEQLMATSPKLFHALKNLLESPVVAGMSASIRDTAHRNKVDCPYAEAIEVLKEAVKK